MKTAIIVVDVQNDFCPGGALAVRDGDQVVPVINKLLRDHPDWVVVASQDWHPAQTPHFDKWSVHCVENTPGAALHPGLVFPNPSEVLYVLKGQDGDGYSAMTPALRRSLHRRGVERVYVVGLATDYCVRATAVDASACFATIVLLPACRAVGDDLETRTELGLLGVATLDYLP
jgi:nicotinamidase/pyrazinamidase